MFSMIKNQ